MSEVFHDPPVGPCRPAPEDWTVESFPAILDRLYREEFTGTLTLHFKDGVPKQADTARKRIRIKDLTTRQK